MATISRREWAIAIGGGLGLAAVLVGALRGGAAPVEPPVEVTPLPAPPPMLVAPPPPAPPAMPDLIVRGSVVRTGGAAAIIEIAGRQRLVREGGSVAPGVTLVRVAARSVVLETAGRQVTIGIGEPGQDAGAAAAVAVAEAAAAGGAGAGAAGGARLRLAFDPVRAGTALVGWRLADPAKLPALAAAGLQPGDVVVSVGGRALVNEEAVLEIPAEIAANPGAKVDFQRNGKSMSVTLPKPEMR